MNSENNNYNLKNVLSLAFLGDAVFTLLVRAWLLKNNDSKPNNLNKLANSVVKASYQAEILRNLKDTLNEEESDIVRRARNSHLNNIAKNSTHEEYSLATQLETLVGYWYLTEQKEKLDNMFKEFVEKKLC